MISASEGSLGSMGKIIGGSSRGRPHMYCAARRPRFFVNLHRIRLLLILKVFPEYVVTQKKTMCGQHKVENWQKRRKEGTNPIRCERDLSRRNTHQTMAIWCVVGRLSSFDSPLRRQRDVTKLQVLPVS